MNLDQLSEFKSHPEILRKLAEFGTVKILKEGEVVQNDNSYIKSIPIVIKGSIRVMRIDADGNELLLYYIQPGESCIMSFLGGIHHEPSHIMAIAEEESEILFIPTEKVGLLIKEFPEWLNYIFRLYHKRFEELLEVVNDVAFKKLDERLYDLLKKKSELLKNKSINITHEQLANDLGTARVVVSRLLKQMEEKGLLQLQRNKVTLV